MYQVIFCIFIDSSHIWEENIHVPSYFSCVFSDNPTYEKRVHLDHVDIYVYSMIGPTY